jgi:DNA-binding PadR family transcriptional regulator
MQDAVLRKLYLGFIQIHILHHAKTEPVYGSWMIAELARHGHTLSAGTLYPILHGLTKAGLLSVEKQTVEGKYRKYYRLTESGACVLLLAKEKIQELTREI